MKVKRTEKMKRDFSIECLRDVLDRIKQDAEKTTFENFEQKNGFCVTKLLDVLSWLQHVSTLSKGEIKLIEEIRAVLETILYGNSEEFPF
ncbi:hypothetical protein EI42_04824 [Thermosporothrix hazakensis]|jgi:hypothetical protein|uniref:Uncharacterized protein n=1 Tax=Thermosporothrix hazakensis TaxID=644383 RepID=A0A326U1S2_THEHA|nr:hypothetical protein [Thermosporothrix hazakensis]PZW23901.1 hypothetical protein EI42_04824 [Thermosporothrix hazakensis]GCE48501.1 hypothetical protein KTH_33700 [Thermosporothrix hazakensis]